MSKEEWDDYSACACIEGIDGKEYCQVRVLSAWQYIWDTGLWTKLQGWYGRTVHDLFDNGLIH